MGDYKKFICDNCGWKYINKDDIFMINKKHEVEVAPLLFSTSDEMSFQPVSGSYNEYYCYTCGEIVKEFKINKIQNNSVDFEDEEIIKYIENYDDSLKIIEFNDKFQKCLKCGKKLDLKENRIKYFILKESGEFEIFDDSFIFAIDKIKRDNDNYKFLGKYHGYFCSDCKKQINKFIIIENPANLNENEIKEILNNHRFDLTVYVEKNSKSCPNCGDELIRLVESSTCPNCGEGKLMLKYHMLID